ncbi:MAG: hypothetical protein OQL20_00580 [Sedimenticola sp.]|nr:hypothetical protein [Sedimenticola sp.]
MITGIIAHLAFVISVGFVRYYLDEPFISFTKRIGTKLVNGSYGLRRDFGSLIVNSINFIEPTKPLKTSLFIEEWNGQGARYNAIYKKLKYDFDTGFPLSSSLTTFYPYDVTKEINVHTSDELIIAINRSQPGDVITLAPGIYRLSGRNIPIIKPGTIDAPIVVRSKKLGAATLELSMLEGFHVKAPYWVFENLVIIGTCKDDSYCEHAFHVVENGHSFTLRNSIIRDFNAHVKVNGVDDKYPDNGLIENTTFYNTRPRITTNPVNVLNINSVDNWRVNSNIIADFLKSKGDKISYAAYMKGNSNNGIFERNLVICEMNLNSDSNTQVGLSFGGGGTAPEFCRDRSCQTEHTNGIIRNNIILNCPTDVGIYLNKSANTHIYNNSIINSLGIDIRFEESTATIVNNIISGRIKHRDGGFSIQKNNLIDIDCAQLGYPKPLNCSFLDWFTSPINDLNFTLIESSNIIRKGVRIEELKKDFCGNSVNPLMVDIGPIQYSNGIACLPNNIQ